MIRMVIAAAGFTIGSLSVLPPASAQDSAGFASPYHRVPSRGTPVDAVPTPFSHGGTCVKLCDYDNTPCDPDYWKVADRRCNFNQKGSY